MEAKSKQLLAEAARWYARLQASDCTDAERAACAQWRSASPEHDWAFLHAVHVAQRVSEGMRSDPRLQSLAAAALRKPVRSAVVSHWRLAAGLVLSIALGLFASTWLLDRSDTGHVAHYENTSLTRQEIILADGSIVHLDVGGRLTARISDSERHLQLLAGRAYFEVKHEGRPFAVDAGSLRTLDLGTRFQVELAPAAVNVTLIEGAVEVSQRARDKNWRETLVPGQQLRFALETGARQKLDVNVAALTSWSQGRLIFKDTPLAEAVEQLNRYASTKIRIGDDSLAAIPIGGDFIAGGDSGHVVEALAAILPLRAVHVGTQEIILFHRYESDAP